MTAEQVRVLELLEQGKINAAEAAELLRALGEEAPKRDDGGSAGGGAPRWFRVRVTETASGRTVANVSIPYGVVNLGLRFAPGNLRFGGAQVRHRVDELLEALQSGRRGTIYDVTDAHEGKRIEIIVE